MSQVQWLLLILAVLVVAAAYLYIRRNADDDPWQGMDEEVGSGEDEFDRGMSLGGDSYIIGVRTIGETEQKPDSPRPAGSQNNGPARSTGSQPSREAELEVVSGADKPVAHGRKPQSGKKSQPPWNAFSPSSRAPRESAGADEMQPRDDVEKVRPQRAPAGEQKLFIVHIATRDKTFFDGPDVHAALQAQKLKFGMHNIYHRITEVNGVPDSVYSVANMLKPGFLDPVEQDHLSTPGLTMFLQLPGPLDGARATRDMLETAGELAQALGGEVLDDKRSLLKAQTAQFMLDEAAEMDRRQRLQAQK